VYSPIYPMLCRALYNPAARHHPMLFMCMLPPVTGLGIPDLNRMISRPRDDVPSIRRVGNREHTPGMPL